eukprot:TRINITY_DN3937_c0_g2_i1.p2 TRINITY_DN3937_c0_g2~~TRINITY_DN3937_c0_g2_i1.p2  ORF type:complete len:114 (+),score=33.94 TRINITY_DN3937_c0_g2_i1:60-401(+)
MVKRKKKAAAGGSGPAPMETGTADSSAVDTVQVTAAAMETSEVVVTPKGKVKVSSNALAVTRQKRKKGRDRRVFKLRKQKAILKAVAVRDRKESKLVKGRARVQLRQSAKALY